MNLSTVDEFPGLSANPEKKKIDKLLAIYNGSRRKALFISY